MEELLKEFMEFVNYIDEMVFDVHELNDIPEGLRNTERVDSPSRVAESYGDEVMGIMQGEGTLDGRTINEVVDLIEKVVQDDIVIQLELQDDTVFSMMTNDFFYPIEFDQHMESAESLQGLSFLEGLGLDLLSNTCRFNRSVDDYESMEEALQKFLPTIDLTLDESDLRSQLDAIKGEMESELDEFEVKYIEMLGRAENSAYEYRMKTSHADEIYDYVLKELSY